ncbi:unknown similar to AMEV010 [Adoxophyes honmai entomopoxvirus 'L']|uniref:Uncharacterized protein n=1 Tax=Adoxophyes honmai entomopoxvirus 'L' TaxID=1293540 RepID=A0A916P0R3_9POXV|nr:unknown similar to AMEV010 [Adoxophyes honmai entomopoxvirus 'L']CCU55561.1 unknown similar to AMEV010 [Adoxophyes honmai entomopoxvirus 'L']
MPYTTKNINIYKNKIIDVKIDDNKRKFIYNANVDIVYKSNSNKLILFPIYGNIIRISDKCNEEDQTDIGNKILKNTIVFNSKVETLVNTYEYYVPSNNVIHVNLYYYKIDHFCNNYKTILKENNVTMDSNDIDLFIKNNKNILDYYVILYIFNTNESFNMTIYIEYEKISKYIILPTSSNIKNNYKYMYKCYIDNVKSYKKNDIIKYNKCKYFKYIEDELLLTDKINNYYYNLNGYIYINKEKVLYIKLDIDSEINNDIIVEII